MLLPRSADKIPCLIRPVKTLLLLPLSCVQYSGWEASLSAPHPQEMELDPSETPLPFLRVVRRQYPPAQYARACPPTSVLSPHSSPCVSAAVPTCRFNHHPCIFSPIVPSLCCIYACILRISFHCCPPRLCLPRAAVSFAPVILSLTMERTFCFSGAGTPLPISAIPFNCFLFVPTIFCLSPWRPSSKVNSGVIMFLFLWGGIPSPTRSNYRGTLRVLFSGLTSAIISLSYHHLRISSPSFDTPC